MYRLVEAFKGIAECMLLVHTWMILDAKLAQKDALCVY